jgi:hypothetical protein
MVGPDNVHQAPGLTEADAKNSLGDLCDLCVIWLKYKI